ncbi:MAG: septum formation initiator family protein [Thermoleophilia bacterium]|nr:septum formation initiator family protein [Thermoleophilia bacterium]MDH4344772.1 septum formation initiator family protein [Thermoleophilia bacterium]MDH5332882.1 septum formation initiator family protein [Thermoleophilia bacterium]
MGTRGGAKGRQRRREPARRGGLAARLRVRRWRLIAPVLVLLVAGFLYAQPLTRYRDTRSDLAARRAEVADLRAENAQLELRLERSTSLVALSREARRVGLVRPGEQLFIVKGIAAWRRSDATVSGDGGP